MVKITGYENSLWEICQLHTFVQINIDFFSKICKTWGRECRYQTFLSGLYKWRKFREVIGINKFAQYMLRI